MYAKIREGVLVALAACAAVPAVPAMAGDLLVRITGLEARSGHVGCALFASDAGFPINNTGRPQEWVPVDGPQATCRFKGIADGGYAVSVVYDVNDNRKLDTNLFGLPTEPWGVSNNVRPRVRAPKFEEARFTMGSATDTSIDVRVEQ